MEFFVLPSLGDPAVQQVVLASVIVVGAFALAQLVSRIVTPVVMGRWAARDGGGGREPAFPISATMRLAVALVILVAASALRFSEVAAQLILAVATGMAAGLLVHRFARYAGAAAASATLLGLITFAGAVIGTLRGLEPVLEGLNAAGLSIGSRRITLLGVLNGAIVIALLFLGTRLAIRLTGRSIDRASGLDHYQRVLIQKLVAVTLVITALLMGVDLLGIDLTALAVFSGAFGLAVGFGLQKTFGNLLSGLILLMDRSVRKCPRRRHRRRGHFRMGQEDRRARGLGHYAGWEGASHSQRTAHDRAGRKLVLLQSRRACPHPAGRFLRKRSGARGGADDPGGDRIHPGARDAGAQCVASQLRRAGLRI